MSKNIFLLLLVFPFFVFATDTLPKQKIKIKKKIITVEIADEDVEQAKGLMFRNKMEANEGMLFVFNDEQTRGFWMKNTLIPLSIAYFDKNKKIIDIIDMQPQPKSKDEELRVYPSTRPAMYALEMNLGWFKKNNIKVGDSFDFLKK